MTHLARKQLVSFLGLLALGYVKDDPVYQAADYASVVASSPG